MKPGTSAWSNAPAEVRYESAIVPKAWREHASSRQLFESVVTNPYFSTLLAFRSSGTRLAWYKAHNTSRIWQVLVDAEATSDFGFQALAYLRGVDTVSIKTISCSDFNGFCWADYRNVCFLASLDSALNSMTQNDRQTLLKLAVWDANYFLSSADYLIVAADVSLIYAIYNKPVSFRGSLPFTLPTLTDDQAMFLDEGRFPMELISHITSAKTALGLPVSRSSLGSKP